MFIRKTLRKNLSVDIHVPEKVEERLRHTCFRGPKLRNAGNFSCWQSASGLFHDKELLELFLTEILDVWKARDFGTHSVEIELKKDIGWESTHPVEHFPRDFLEEFSPNCRSSALRLKAGHREITAPRTNLVTIVYEFKSENNRPIAIVHSLYPGHDIGELDGNITAEEGRFFFDWNQPGA